MDSSLQWCGLVPGVSSVSDAVAELGVIESETQIGNGKIYSFLDGQVCITQLNGSVSIFKIWISAAKDCKRDPLPPDLEAALSRWGHCNQVTRESQGLALFERPGVRIACDTAPHARPVRWVELYDPSFTAGT